MKDEVIKLSMFQVVIGSDRFSYHINGRKAVGGSQVHAYSPEVIPTGARFKSALYFISCDFLGNSLEYTQTKLEAAKAYLDTLNIPYKIIICDVLPRHNWKRYFRQKEISFQRFDELLITHNNDGKKSAEALFDELRLSEDRPSPLTDSEEEIEALSTKITLSANAPRVKLCQDIFSDEKVITWSSMMDILPSESVQSQEILDACHDAIKESARLRDGDLKDNCEYKKEELVIDLYLGHFMKAEYGDVIAFYNRFSSHQNTVQHMKACEQFGHFSVLDLRYCDEVMIHQILLSADLIIKKPFKLNDPEKQTESVVRMYRSLGPTYQRRALNEITTVESHLKKLAKGSLLLLSGIGVGWFARGFFSTAVAGSCALATRKSNQISMRTAPDALSTLSPDVVPTLTAPLTIDFYATVNKAFEELNFDLSKTDENKEPQKLKQ